MRVISLSDTPCPCLPSSSPPQVGLGSSPGQRELGERVGPPNGTDRTQDLHSPPHLAGDGALLSHVLDEADEQLLGPVRRTAPTPLLGGTAGEVGCRQCSRTPRGPR